MSYHVSEREIDERCEAKPGLGRMQAYNQIRSQQQLREIERRKRRVYCR